MVPKETGGTPEEAQVTTEMPKPAQAMVAMVVLQVQPKRPRRNGEHGFGKLEKGVLVPQWPKPRGIVFFSHAAELTSNALSYFS